MPASSPAIPPPMGASGCPIAFAPKLFQITTVGDGVVIARDRPVPTLIEHPNLFQPMPPPPPPAVTQEDKPARQQSGDATSTRPDLGRRPREPCHPRQGRNGRQGDRRSLAAMPEAAPKPEGTARKPSPRATPDGSRDARPSPATMAIPTGPMRWSTRRRQRPTIMPSPPRALRPRRRPANPRQEPRLRLRHRLSPSPQVRRHRQPPLRLEAHQLRRPRRARPRL